MERPDSEDWVVSDLLEDPARLFVLWFLRAHPSVSLSDFRRRFGPGFPIDELAEGLQKSGFLLLQDGDLILTDTGMQVTDCLPESVNRTIGSAITAGVTSRLGVRRALARRRATREFYQRLGNRSYMSISRMLVRLAVGIAIVLIIAVALYIHYRQAPDPIRGGARLEGTVTDRSANVLGNMAVSIRSGPETRTDSQGKFVLGNIAAGDQLIVVKSPSGGGQLTQNVRLTEATTTRTNIVYDASTSQLGLLSITAPVEDSSVEVRQVDGRGKTTVYGRCDGLPQIFGSFDVWVLVKPETAASFFVQHPPAVVNHTNGTWMSDIWLGEPDHAARNGDRWTIIAVAANPDSDINRIASTPRLNLLPPHLESNVVTFFSVVKVSRNESTHRAPRLTTLIAETSIMRRVDKPHEKRSATTSL